MEGSISASDEAALQERLGRRIAEDTGGQPMLPTATQWAEPEWEEVLTGISCKILAIDTERHVVSMLVRLAALHEYPHTSMQVPKNCICSKVTC